MQFFIGIDIGTTVSKGVILDRHGMVIHQYQVLHDYLKYADYADAWWNEVLQIVKELSVCVVDKTSITSITVSAMVPNLVMLDSEGYFALKTRLFTDDFAIEEQNRLDKIDGTKWRNETLSKMIVLRKKEENWRRVAHILTTHCYIGYKFTGKYYCDYASAFEYGNVFDEKGGKWNDVLLSKYDIENDLLPPLVSSISTIGFLKKEIADLLNLPEGIKIIAGSHDSIASMIGAGLNTKGDGLIYYGTFNCSALIHANLIDILLGKIDSSPIEWTASIPDSGPQFTTMCKLLTGGCNYNEFDRYASLSPAGSNGVIFLQNPNLLNTSISSSADGAFSHITSKTSIADLCRAVYEAFPYGILAFWKSNFVSSYPNCFFASGGGARSHLRVQIVSDVISIKQYKLAFSENAVGTALIGVASENQALFVALQNQRREQAVCFTPNTENNNTYKAMAKEYWSLLQKGISEK